MPLVKWILAIPHYVVWVLLAIGALIAVVIAWFAILITGKMQEGLFN
jgi:high-affinity Fe2+/Pb2+ permease